jgi:hypothetical protein
MRLEVEGKLPIDEATEGQVRSAVLALRSYGPSSFASLTDDNGSYLQIAGGGVTCMLERRDASAKRHYRAYHDVDRPIHPDGTLLVFGGGEIPLKADEWFTAPIVSDAFVSFLNGDELPGTIKWRDVTDLFPDLAATL